MLVKSNPSQEREAPGAFIDELDGGIELAPQAQATEKRKRPARKNILQLFGLTILGCGAVASGIIWWQHSMSFEGTDDAFIAGHVHQMSAKVSGTVTKVNIEDNQHVKAGDLLVQVDPTDLQLSADSAKAALIKAELQAVEAESAINSTKKAAGAQRFEAVSSWASSQAQVNKAEEALSEAKAGVRIAETQIRQRQAELTRASADFERYKTLFDDRATTKQSLDKAKQDKDVAEANLAAAQVSYDQSAIRVHEFEQSLADARTSTVRAHAAEASAEAANDQTETSKRTLSVQRAAAQQAKVQLDNALTQLSYTKITAPVSGTIGHKTVEVGQQIERGQALMSVVSDEKWVNANFKETQLSHMRVGQEVEIKIDSFPDKTFKGSVDSISPASGAQFALLPPDNATGNFTKVVQRISVKIVFDPQSIKGYEKLVTPGMSVVAEVHISK